MQRFLKIFLSLMLLLLPIATFAADATAEQKPVVELQGVIGNDFYAAGPNIDSSEAVEDDALMAGATVNVSSKIGGDLNVAGSSLNIVGDVGDDLRAVGGNILVAGNVGGSALIAGGNISVSNKAVFNSESRIAGGVINFAGKTVGNMSLMGGTVNYSGVTEGDLKINAKDQIVISPTAKVTGKLIYTAKEKLDIPAGVAKEVLYLPSESKTTPQGSGLLASVESLGLLGKAFSGLVFLIAGMFVLGLLGKASFVIAETARNQIWQSALTGALLFLLPVFLGLLLLATGVGSIVGVFVLLGWIALLLTGGVLSGFIVGSFIWKQTPDITYGKKLLTLLVGLVIVAALSFIPKFGGLLSFLIFIYSVGVVALSKLALYKAAKKAKLL